MVHDTRITCDCCHQRESRGGCTIGVVNCRCETKPNSFIHSVLLCPVCFKCPVHCLCGRCDCGDIELYGHSRDCQIPITCREKIEANDKVKARMKGVINPLEYF